MTEDVPTKSMIKTTYIDTVESYVQIVRVEEKIMKVIAQDVIDLILFFYARPIIINVKYLSSIKFVVIDVEPVSSTWSSLQNKILSAYGFASGGIMKALRYDDGTLLTKPDFESFEWDKNTVFEAVIDIHKSQYSVTFTESVLGLELFSDEDGLNCIVGRTVSTIAKQKVIPESEIVGVNDQWLACFSFADIRDTIKRATREPPLTVIFINKMIQT
eukprot:227288_1